MDIDAIGVVPIEYAGRAFRAGVDEGLRAWLRMRDMLRNIGSHSKDEELILSGIKYKYHSYWNDMLLYKEKSSEIAPITNLNDFEDFIREDFVEAFKYALSVSHVRYLNSIIDYVEDINMKLDDHGNTALHIAAFNGDISKVEILVKESEIDINSLNDRKKTPLQMSIRKPFQFHTLTLYAILLEDGNNVNNIDINGSTALHDACRVGNLELAALLLKEQANVYILDNRDKSPLQYVPEALKEEFKEVFRLHMMYRGKGEHQKLWAHIISREFVKSVFEVAEPNCINCKRKIKDCESLKLRNYRLWLWVHGKIAKFNKGAAV